MTIEEVIDRAILFRKTIEIEYITRSGSLFRCRISDIRYSTYRDGGYIEAFREDMKLERIFKISRILKVNGHMKKFIFIIIALVTCLIAVGTLWNQDVRKEQGCGKYQDELAKKTAKINELEDSIRNMQAKIDFYDEAVNWLRGVDDEELERAIRLIRSFPKDAPLP